MKQQQKKGHNEANTNYVACYQLAVCNQLSYLSTQHR